MLHPPALIPAPPVRRRSARPRSRTVLLGGLLALALIPAGNTALAQDEAAGELEAAAAAASAAVESMKSAAERVVGPEPTVAAPEAAATEAAEPAAAPPAEPAVTEEDLRRVEERAERAEAEARKARKAVEAHEEAHRRRFSRTGPTLTGGVFYAPQYFDSPYKIVSSKGASGSLGYRVGERWEIDATFDWLDGFGVEGFGSKGQLDGWSLSANAKFFIFTGRIQPYLGLGIGGMQADLKLERQSDGRIVRDDAAAPLMRASAGIDFYASEAVVFVTDATMNLPTGNLSGLNYATLGVKLKLRF